MHASETWQLRFYQTPESRVPFRQWQASLTDPRFAAAVEVRLDRLRQGLFGDCKPVGEGVLEIRIDLGPGFRVTSSGPDAG